jgi:hypothetical protein
MKDDNGIPYQVINRMVPGMPATGLLDARMYLRNLRKLRLDQTGLNGEQHSSPEAAPSEPAAAPAAEPDLDALLKEYDAQVQPQPSPLGQPVEPEQQQEPDLEQLLADLDRQQQQPQTAPVDPLAAERDQLRQQLAEAQHRETVQRDLTDFEEVEAALDKDLREVFSGRADGVCPNVSLRNGYGGPRCGESI